MESTNPTAPEHSWDYLKTRLQALSGKLHIIGVEASDLHILLTLVEERLFGQDPFSLRLFGCEVNIEIGQDQVLIQRNIAAFCQSVEEKLNGDEHHEVVTREVRKKMLALTEYQDLIRNLRTGYDECLAVLDAFGICKGGNFKITALDGRLYQIPSFVDIEKELMTNPDHLRKIKSLMTLPKLILTPIGLPLKTQVMAADTKKFLSDRFGKLIQEDIRITHPDADLQPVEVSIISNPSQLLYFPTRIPRKNQKSDAITKQEFISQHGGWLVSVAESGEDAVQENTIPFSMKGVRDGGVKNYKDIKEGLLFETILQEGLRGICFDEYLMLYMIGVQKTQAFDMRSCTAMMGNITSEGRFPFGFFGSDSLRLRFDHSPGNVFCRQPLGRRAALTVPMPFMSEQKN